MRPSIALDQHRADIRRVVTQHRAVNVRVFGSVARGRDKDGSDLDLVINPTGGTTLMDVAAIQIELEALLGVPVDVVTPNALPASFRESVLAEALPV